MAFAMAILRACCAAACLRAISAYCAVRESETCDTDNFGRVAFVAGATGATGREIVALLLADSRYERVIAASRSRTLDATSFPGLPATADRSKLSVATGVDNYTALDAATLGGANVILCTLGTNRHNAEVEADVEAGLEESINTAYRSWYDRVDIGYSVALAKLAVEDGARVFGRVGLQDRAWPTKQVFKLTFPRGLVHLRPRRLDRGPMQRPDEVCVGDGCPTPIPVREVARRLLEEIDIAFDRPYPGLPYVVEHEDILGALSNDEL